MCCLKKVIIWHQSNKHGYPPKRVDARDHVFQSIRYPTICGNNLSQRSEFWSPLCNWKYPIFGGNIWSHKSHRNPNLVYLSIPNFDYSTLNQVEVDIFKTPNMGDTNPNGKGYNRAHGQRNSKIEQFYRWRVKQMDPRNLHQGPTHAKYEQIKWKWC